MASALLLGHGMAPYACAKLTASAYVQRVVLRSHHHHPPQKTRGSDELTNFRDTSNYCEQLAWHTTKETILVTAISDRMLRYVASSRTGSQQKYNTTHNAGRGTHVPGALLPATASVGLARPWHGTPAATCSRSVAAMRRCRCLTCGRGSSAIHCTLWKRSLRYAL